MNGCNYPSFADDVRQLKTSNDNNHGAGLLPSVVIFCCCRAVRNEPENETISDPAKTVVITCNDNMSSYMTTRQVRHLFCVFHTEHKKTLRRIFQQSIVNALQLLFQLYKQPKRSSDRPKARTYSEANIP